jgi:hypothetical protein
MNPDFTSWYRRLKMLGAIAVLGSLAFAVCMVHGPDGVVGRTALILGFLTVLPVFVYLYCLTILHWKHRYVGQHSTLWGVLLLLETSGWMKIVYFFRHMLPDMKKTGRYAKRPNQTLEPTAPSGRGSS